MGSEQRAVQYSVSHQHSTVRMKLLGVFLLLLSLALICEAGVRCFFGSSACSASCVVLAGHTSGICDGNGECICSEKSISLDILRSYLPSRCNLGDSFCEVTCNSIGRANGTCSTDTAGGRDCTCSDKVLSPREFALCGAESTCRLDCQRRGLATGACFGWSCKCLSNLDDLPEELQELRGPSEES